MACDRSVFFSRYFGLLHHYKWRHDITETLLKAALNTQPPTPPRLLSLSGFRFVNIESRKRWNGRIRLIPMDIWIWIEYWINKLHKKMCTKSILLSLMCIIHVVLIEKYNVLNLKGFYHWLLTNKTVSNVSLMQIRSFSNIIIWNSK